MDSLTDNQKLNVVQVALRLGRRLSTLTYLRPVQKDNLVGRRVRVEVGKRVATGVITSEGKISNKDGVKLKAVQFVTDETPVLNEKQLELARFVSDYYESSFYDVLRLCLPKTHKAIEAKVFQAKPTFLQHLKATFGRDSKSTKIRKAYLIENGYSDKQINELIIEGEIEVIARKNKFPKHLSKIIESRVFELTGEQKKAIDAILSAERNAFLLQGVTGSGKTEVYLEVAKKIFSEGKSVLFIVPEIALTPQLLRRVELALCAEAVVIHSNVNSAERDMAFEKIRSGEVRVIIGARSALFCPAKDLGLIIVDEEHDAGFKQEESPRYHARDVALWRAKNENAKIILGSATPSLESLHNVAMGRLQHLRLTSRAGNSVLPKVEIIDLCERKAHDISRLKDRSASFGSPLCILSSPLRTAIQETLAKKEQVILFLNRRGWASYLICEECGHILKCPDCSVSLTYHKKTNQLRCHQCSYTKAFSTKCAECPNGVLKPLGLGTERVEKELQMSFPNAIVARFDKESVRHQKDLDSTLEKLHNGEIQILIGTQMIAKGHDFPNVTLVGVVLADNGLGLPDFRASERSFQLLTQVSGRAGRRNTQGRVIIQTFNAEHPAIVFAKSHDVDGFCELELAERKRFFYPPYSRTAVIRFESTEELEAEKISEKAREILDLEMELLKAFDDAQILGPAPCPNVKLRQYYRWQIFLKAKSVSLRKHLLHSLKNNVELQKWGARSKSRIIIDVDPVQLL